ncbi:alpha/beta fold hydrolase [Actinomadura nitritigenes]|uniref:alpha/beta fold hydrolase n=1 Tax=Actinomadura nitritigenes TaxID=134602 RepID=UPI003D8ED60A
MEAFRTSEDGWVDDLLTFCAPRGFDIGDIAFPTLLWHGAEDRFAPAAHSVRLAAGIPTSTLLVQSGSAHFDALTMLPRLFAWVNTQDRMPVAACGHRLIRRPVRLLNHLFGRAH